MGEPMPKWMTQYMRLIREVDSLRLKTDPVSQKRLDVVLVKIKKLVDKYSKV